MKVISIVGKVDTRVIVYPLAKALSMSGMVVIISEDGAYKRLYNGTETTGTVSGVDIVVGTNISQELANQAKDTGIQYDYVIVVSSSIVPPIANCALVCKGIDKSINSSVKHTELDDSNDVNIDNRIEIPDGIPNKSLYISYDTAPKYGIPSLKLKDGYIRYIYGCEESKELHIVDDKNYIKTVASLMGELINMEEKELCTLLARQEYLAKDGKAK